MVFMRLIAVTLVIFAVHTVSAQDRAAFQREFKKLAAAQLEGNETEGRRIAGVLKKLLGEKAGIPESLDQFRTTPGEAEPLKRSEIPKAFDNYLREIKRRKWWRIGEDPTKTDYKPRQAASVIVGCLAAARSECNNKDELLAVAKDAGDYLFWTQQQGGKGLFPFPAREGGKGKVFQIPDRFL